MTDAYSYPIEALSRHVPSPNVFSFLGVDFTGSTYLMHVREVKDTTATPVIVATSAISLLYAGSATIAVHIAAGRLTDAVLTLTNPDTDELYAETDTVLLSQLSIKLTKTMLESAPYPAEVGDDYRAWYDVIRTPSAGDTEIILRGPLIIDAAVSIPA
jgi:hypothetical protein